LEQGRKFDTSFPAGRARQVDEAAVMRTILDDRGRARARKLGREERIRSWREPGCHSAASGSRLQPQSRALGQSHFGRADVDHSIQLSERFEALATRPSPPAHLRSMASTAGKPAARSVSDGMFEIET
jgi:hypothetical protein